MESVGDIITGETTSKKRHEREEKCGREAIDKRSDRGGRQESATASEKTTRETRRLQARSTRGELPATPSGKGSECNPAWPAVSEMLQEGAQQQQLPHPTRTKRRQPRCNPQGSETSNGSK